MKNKIWLICTLLIMSISNVIIADDSKANGNYTIEIERKEHPVPDLFLITYDLTLKPKPGVRSEYCGGADTEIYQNTGLDSRLIVTRKYGGESKQILNESIEDLLNSGAKFGSNFVKIHTWDKVVGTFYSSIYDIHVGIRLVHDKEGNALIMVRILDVKGDL